MNETTKDALVRLPRRLSAENGAKALLLGEFAEREWVDCPECAEKGASPDCESCKGKGSVPLDVPISWTTIEAIYNKIVEHFAT
jgi:hypothetical protein